MSEPIELARLANALMSCHARHVAEVIAQTLNEEER